MKIRIELSDRTRARNFEINNAADTEAVLCDMVGGRFLSCRLDSYTDDSRVYEVMVATGPTRNGSTPFTNIRAYVTLNA